MSRCALAVALTALLLVGDPAWASNAQDDPRITPVRIPSRIVYSDSAVITVRVEPPSSCTARLVGQPQDADVVLAQQSGGTLTWHWTNSGHLRPGSWSIRVECEEGDPLVRAVSIESFEDENCANHICYSPVVSSGAYSAMGGILAGFAFAAIVLLLSLNEDRRLVSPAVVAFVGALVCLMIGTFMFAANQGEEGVYPRSYMLTYLASLSLAPGVLLVFFGISLLTHATAVRSRLIDGATTLVVPFISLVYLGNTGMVATDIHREDAGLGTWYGRATVAVVGIATLALAASMKWRLDGRDSPRSVPALVLGGLIVSVAAAGASAWWGDLPVRESLPGFFFVLSTGLVALGALLVAIEVNRKPLEGET